MTKRHHTFSKMFGMLQSMILILPTLTTGMNDFKVFWNIPTFMCRKYNISMVNATRYFGIIQNENDDFRGDQIALLYDPGMFPAILYNTSTKSYFYRNGGVPQQGDLGEHLRMFEQHVNQQIQNPAFDGLAIIDFESWRPIFRQNMGSLQPYRDLSVEIESIIHPFWPLRRLEREAQRRFEVAGRNFVEQTLILARRLRPFAAWGYYAYPYCFNGRGKNVEVCPSNVKAENDRIMWLIENSDTLHPSVYLQETLPVQNRVPMISGRIQEARRLTNKIPYLVRPWILVYHRYVFTDTKRYLSKEETYTVLQTIKQNGADGIILWGSSYDLQSKAKCLEFYYYLVDVLGPVIQSLQPEFYVSLLP